MTNKFTSLKLHVCRILFQKTPTLNFSQSHTLSACSRVSLLSVSSLIFSVMLLYFLSLFYMQTYISLWKKKIHKNEANFPNQKKPKFKQRDSTSQNTSQQHLITQYFYNIFIVEKFMLSLMASLFLEQFTSGQLQLSSMKGDSYCYISQ